jgi:hypothetical protein
MTRTKSLDERMSSKLTSCCRVLPSVIVCLDVTCSLPYIGNVGFQNVLFGNAPDVRLFSRPTCSGTRSIPHGRAWSMTSPQRNPNYRLLITTVWAERPQRRARLLQLTGKSVTRTKGCTGKCHESIRQEVQAPLPDVPA